MTDKVLPLDVLDDLVRFVRSNLCDWVSGTDPRAKRALDWIRNLPTAKLKKDEIGFNGPIFTRLQAAHDFIWQRSIASNGNRPIVATHWHTEDAPCIAVFLVLTLCPDCDAGTGWIWENESEFVFEGRRAAFDRIVQPRLTDRGSWWWECHVECWQTLAQHSADELKSLNSNRGHQHDANDIKLPQIEREVLIAIVQSNGPVTRERLPEKVIADKRSLGNAANMLIECGLAEDAPKRKGLQPTPAGIDWVRTKCGTK